MEEEDAMDIYERVWLQQQRRAAMDEDEEGGSSSSDEGEGMAGAGGGAAAAAAGGDVLGAAPAPGSGWGGEREGVAAFVRDMQRDWNQHVTLRRVSGGRGVGEGTARHTQEGEWRQGGGRRGQHITLKSQEGE